MASRTTKTRKNHRQARRAACDAATTARTFTLGDPITSTPLTDLLPGRHIEVTSTEVETLAFDTVSHGLARAGVSLTRHSDPPGWSLHAPAADVHLTSGSRARTVPATLLRAVIGLSRGEALVQTGQVRAEIRSLVITELTAADVAAEGTEQGEITPVSTPLTLVETTTRVLTGGDEGSLSTVRQVTLGGDVHGVEVLRTALLQAGAVPRNEQDGPDAESLLTRPPPGTAPRSDEVPETLGELVRRYLDAQLDAIVLGDLVLRSGRPAVHRTRVAVRRARSTLRTFSPLFDAAGAEAFGGELRWYAHLLGEVRDRDVLHDRLMAQISALDGADVLGPVASNVESALASERSEHLREVEHALDSERYAALLMSVEQWRTAPPLTDRAARSATKAEKLLRKAENTLDRRLADVLVGESDLHPARKAAKRLRYAAELSEPVLGKVARKTVTRNEALQTLLGEHQDSTVSAEFLRRTATVAGTRDGHHGYTYGLLVAHEQHRATRVRDQVLHALGG